MCIYVHELSLKAVDSSSKPCYAPPAAHCFLPAVWLVLHSHMSALPECETWTHLWYSTDTSNTVVSHVLKKYIHAYELA